MNNIITEEDYLKMFSRDNCLEILRKCGGYYSCPKTLCGAIRLGPLVGYAGEYVAPDRSQKQFVGDVYVNFSQAEEHPDVLKFFARGIVTLVDTQIGPIDFLCGAPIGGYALSTAISVLFGYQMIIAEKKITSIATLTSREKSKLVFARHRVKKGRKYVIVEDVCNNFSTTEKLIELICSAGGHVSGIVCFLNRSLTVESVYHSDVISCDIPVVSLVRLLIKEYKQDDSEVAEDIKAGNVVWKPKDEWLRLIQEMKSRA